MDDPVVGLHAIRTFDFVSIGSRGLMASPLVMSPIEYKVSESDYIPVWDKGTCVAECRLLGRHPKGASPPADGCSCGVYGSLSLSALRKATRLPERRDLDFIAVIAAEGPTVVGTLGLRTAAARVVAHWGEGRYYINPKLFGDPGLILPHEAVDAVFPDSKRYEHLDDMLEAYNIPKKCKKWRIWW